MPRVGGEFVAPFDPVEPDTTIESVVHNGIVADFVADANNPRPVTAGGTGANNVGVARLNLQVERSMQVVTNYANHVFETGSFQSAAGATDSPPSGTAPHVGVALVLDASNIILMAWNVSGTDPSEAYFWQREKIAGAWLPWYSLSINMAYMLPKAGGTMTGFLTLNANPVNPLHATPKQYVDSAIVSGVPAGALMKAGGTMTGPINMTGDAYTAYITVADPLSTDPTHNKHVVNMDYVHNRFVNRSSGLMTGNLNITAPLPSYHTLTLNNTASVDPQGIQITLSGYTVTNPGVTAYLITGISTDGVRFVVKGNGDTHNVNNVFGAWSDGDIKGDIEDVEPAQLDKINALRPVKFNFLFEGSEAPRHTGVIAQEAETVFPEHVSTDENGVRLFNYMGLMMPMVKAMQELTAQVSTLKAGLEALERRLL